MQQKSPRDVRLHINEEIDDDVSFPFRTSLCGVLEFAKSEAYKPAIKVLGSFAVTG